MAAAGGVLLAELIRQGLTEQQAGRNAQALTHFRAAIARDPKNATALHLLGHLYIVLGQYGEALPLLRTAAALQPTPEIYLELATACTAEKLIDEAATHYERALELQPNLYSALNNLAELRKSQGEIDAAEDAYRRLLALQPDFLVAQVELGNLLMLQGRHDEALAAYRAVLEVDPGFTAAHSNYVYALNFHHDYTATEVFEEHRRWGERHAAPLRHALPPITVDRTAGRRLRVGYVSPDFWHHPVCYFIEPVLRYHDRERFEIICYSDVARPDQYTRRLQSYPVVWKDTRSLSDGDLAQLIREDKVDILVDLTGHTQDNRLLTFARKPAPVQITWCGYINTTGMNAIDYRITDSYADPPGMTERLHTERLLRLPEIYMAYEPPQDSPPVAAPPRAANGYVTFGSLNTLRKITPPVIAAWAQILKILPDDRLAIFSVPEGRARDRLVQAFRDQGVASRRLDLIGKLSFQQFLKAHAQVDIALDPFPFNGATTTSINLWMGVPVITLAGPRHAARAGVSMLSNLGLVQWIAANEPDYVRLAVELARDADECAVLRASLRQRMLTSPNTDGPRLTGFLEAAYAKIWNDYCLQGGI